VPLRAPPFFYARRSGAQTLSHDELEDEEAQAGKCLPLDLMPRNDAFDG
jgi:hypothetical protein